MLGRFDWAGVIDFLPELGIGLYYTLLISVLGLLIGFILGAIFGIGRISKNKLVYGLSTVYVEVIRGTPVLVQAIWIFFALPLIIGQNLGSITAGVIVIALNSGAYIAEIVRGAVDSIEKGQMEAGRSLGLNQGQTMRYIVWPQAFKRMIPPLGNQFIISIKDTSLLSVILVPELIFQGRLIAANHFNAVEIYTTVALFYLAITLSLSVVLRYVERRLTT
ncbi:amino acid ABC transporter permease [Virgibacillus halodenitrificans]|uniref:Amino acid ABC transporter permease n=1 Tax=Virgibacillus halodenitrificans TaxID=1482 RepID=A0AAC9J0F4_VIRHA|nr:amino acid ABC transporter permease [Virgibacillus halodenitrificans]APC49281.1 nickel transporter [Virgibacillus halodenitrificans]MBD1223800.1 amino acid ABC transporter permease [Virgibacillus halodenitrificans]MCG1026690.1 amino acid ABC transporter permease [Virgibacillus halodenitrificans]MCJ0930094.1 amino acid ABC transporter permease [Virgibacillus halodenitrificans]MEC2160959.1 amino acid ABC transporter permease [Virgibacillus halodenitrificans]